MHGTGLVQSSYNSRQPLYPRSCTCNLHPQETYQVTQDTIASDFTLVFFLHISVNIYLYSFPSVYVQQNFYVGLRPAHPADFGRRQKTQEVPCHLQGQIIVLRSSTIGRFGQGNPVIHSLTVSCHPFCRCI